MLSILAMTEFNPGNVNGDICSIFLGSLQLSAAYILSIDLKRKKKGEKGKSHHCLHVFS